jgi:radical SAM superfamily enzyme YgiQ (UPF0313 family)
VPLAAGALAVAARRAGLGSRLAVDVLSPAVSDVLGDALLADYVAREAPEYFGLSLYLWNVERSLALARAVRARSPRTKVLIGGPEVGPDNPWLLEADGFDVAVTGEAEQGFVALLERLLRGEDPAGLPGVAVRRDGRTLPFGPEPRADFPLSEFPSPYLEGLLPVEAKRSVYLETVRGCRSQCTFCFYPRSSNVLRALDPDSSARLVAEVAARGARDVVFLDPTFNHRPGFDELLAKLAEVNRDRTLSFFAEVRAEGLTEAHADRLAEAGFTKLEIGLQSVNPRALKLSKRGGSPAEVARAAAMLKARGIKLLVDLIIGLPGDGPADVARGADFLAEHGLGDDAQVFPLAILPGTAMRASAAADGVLFEPRPPYRVTKTATFTADDLRASLFAAEDRLGRRLDETPRPFLVDPDAAADPPDVFVVDCDADDPAALDRARRPGAQHVALWFSGRELFAARRRILSIVTARLAVDPYATLDVVLRPGGPFPLDLLDDLRRAFAEAPASYLSRALALRGEDAQRRIAVVLGPGVKAPRDWGLAAAAEVPVFRDQSFAAAAETPSLHGDGRPGARIVDAPPDDDGAAWSELFAAADPEAVVFARRDLEAAWTGMVLGHRRPDEAPPRR